MKTLTKELNTPFYDLTTLQVQRIVKWVEKKIIGKDERSAEMNGDPAQDATDDIRNRLRQEQREKLK